MTQLGLAGPEFSKCLRDRHAFNSTLQKSIELYAASGNSLDVFTFLENLHACLKALTLNLLSNLEALLCLSFGNAFDVEHVFFGAVK